MARSEDTRTRFLRLANARINKAIKAIALVGNLSDRSNYSYSEEDTTRMFDALDQAIRDCKQRYRAASRQKPQEFKL